MLLQRYLDLSPGRKVCWVNRAQKWASESPAALCSSNKQQSAEQGREPSGYRLSLTEHWIWTWKLLPVSALTHTLPTVVFGSWKETVCHQRNTGLWLLCNGCSYHCCLCVALFTLTLWVFLTLSVAAAADLEKRSTFWEILFSAWTSHSFQKAFVVFGPISRFGRFLFATIYYLHIIYPLATSFPFLYYYVLFFSHHLLIIFILLWAAAKDAFW